MTITPSSWVLVHPKHQPDKHAGPPPSSNVSPPTKRRGLKPLEKVSHNHVCYSQLGKVNQHQINISIYQYFIIGPIRNNRCLNSMPMKKVRPTEVALIDQQNRMVVQSGSGLKFKGLKFKSVMVFLAMKI